MSTIMKALRRLESDKSRRTARSLREEVVRGAESRRRSPALLIGMGVFAVGLALGAGALLFWPTKLTRQADGAAPAAPVEVARPAAQPPAAAPPRPAPLRPKAARNAERMAADQKKRAELARARQVAPPAVASAGRESAPPAVASAGRESAPPAVAGASRESAPAPTRESAPARRPEPQVAVVRSIEPPPLDLRDDDAAADARPRAGETRPAAAALKPPVRRSAEAPAPRVEPAPEPVVAAAAEPSAAPEPARDSGSPEPDLRGLAGRGPVPVILVARTLWHPSAERREALIEVEEGAGPERRRVREGEMVGPLRVEKIEPSGVVFDYDGTELRHAVGSD